MSRPRKIKARKAPHFKGSRKARRKTEDHFIRKEILTTSAKKERRIERSIERRADIRRHLAERHSPYRDYVLDEDLDDVA
jgi:hypothetical protein